MPVPKLTQHDLMRLMMLAYIEGWCDSPETPGEWAAVLMAWKDSAARRELQSYGMTLGEEVDGFARCAGISAVNVHVILDAGEA